MGGGDKCLRLVGGRPILDRIVARVQGQVMALAISANGDPERFAALALPVVGDSLAAFPGPLAGILAGLDWAAGLGGFSHLASFAGDAPFLPGDLVARLTAALSDGRHDLAYAVSAGRAHPVFALWPMARRAELRRALTQEGLRKVELWAARHRAVAVEFAAGPLDPFFNVNGPADLIEAERLAPIDRGPESGPIE